MPSLTSRIENKMGYSARSISSMGYGSSRLSSRSYDCSMTSVRHVNSDESIDNAGLLDALDKDNEKYAMMLESQTDIVLPLDMECEENYPTTRDKAKYASMSETQADLVPPLDIKSEENYPTTRDYTFSYRKHCNADTIFKPDKAFETWLSAKRKLLSDEAARRKKEEEMKQKEIEERKRLAKEKYEGWLQKKTQSAATLPSVTNPVVKENKTSETQTHSKHSPEEARARLREWENEKRKKEEQRRIRKLQEEQRRHELEEERRQMAAEAWEHWVSNANKKPKPVPLNRGIFTLRGTVSDIFVNPNEWKSIIPAKKEEN